MIDRFTKERFEQALPPGYVAAGFSKGEYVYRIALDPLTHIEVRSTVGADGVAGNVGDDSIRLWLCNSSNNKPLASKEISDLARWITRVRGWESRLSKAIESLRALRAEIGNCKCGSPNVALVSNSAKNPGRVFKKCFACQSWNGWLDTSAPKDVAEERSEIAQVEPVRAADTITAPRAPGAVAPKRAFAPSDEQVAIADFVIASDANLCVNAYAGSGKTTNDAYVCERYIARFGTARTVASVVFNKANAEEMKSKFPAQVDTMTAHSAGLACIRAAGSRIRVEERKIAQLFREHWDRDTVQATYFSQIKRLVGACKNMLLAPNTLNLDYICERFDIELPLDVQDVVYAAVAVLYAESLNIRTVVDFDDMILFPALGIVPVSPYDFLVVDEAQDTNAARQAFYRKLGRRIMFVGDRYQAIYGFAGADTSAMQTMIEVLKAHELPLSISWRSDRKIIELAQTKVPGIRARADAADGEVRDVAGLGDAVAGDMVLCRNNAPLVKPCFQMIRDGKAATIRGRDIGKGLVEMIDRIAKQTGALTLTGALSDLQEYGDREIARLQELGRERQADFLSDQVETLVALADGCVDMTGLRLKVVGDPALKIEGIFSDANSGGVVFSTVHKAKGLEAGHVHILKPELLEPQKYDKQPWQLEQLNNLSYVAITRAKHQLNFVRAQS